MSTSGRLMNATGLCTNVLKLWYRLISRGAAPAAFWMMALSMTLQMPNKDRCHQESRQVRASPIVPK